MTEFVRMYLTSTNAVDLANMVAAGSDIRPIGPILNFEKVKDLIIFVLGEKSFEAQIRVQMQDPVTKAMLIQMLIVDFTQDEHGKYHITKVWSN